MLGTLSVTNVKLPVSTAEPDVEELASFDFATTVGVFGVTCEVFLAASVFPLSFAAGLLSHPTIPIIPANSNPSRIARDFMSLDSKKIKNNHPPRRLMNLGRLAESGLQAPLFP
jgi:hypothetical protein